MCEIGKEIKLCTCFPATMSKIVHHKNSRKLKNKARNEFTWTLKKYIGDIHFPMEGMITFPLDALSDDLTTEKMLVDLNARNCFDFDYLPKDGDYLQIFAPHRYEREFLSFIYREGEWKADYYDSFRDETEKINYGKVTFE
jgi:hypothetical protein